MGSSAVSNVNSREIISVRLTLSAKADPTSDHQMVSGWTALFTRTRSGGANALKGFEFQKAYAQLRLVWLLTGKNGVVEVRYEGAQDIDIRYGNGEQQFVQEKDYAWGKLTRAAIYDALAGFTRDLTHARKQGTPEKKFLRFTLISPLGLRPPAIQDTQTMTQNTPPPTKQAAAPVD